LDPKRFFKSGDPAVQASSFDLTIGCIFDHEGKKVDGPFTIKPGHMVQVVSAEVFSLPDCVTGHVTYKTTLTKKGIWALTVGIVDPGWEGPVATTLLNFSRVDHAIAEGDAFLRVSLFEHAPVAAERMRKAPPLEAYLKDIQKTAASSFPTTFLDSEKIAEAAGDKVLERVRKEALVQDSDDLRAKMDAMQARLFKYEQATPPAPAPTPANTPTVPPSPPRNR
jgi:dUTPase